MPILKAYFTAFQKKKIRKLLNYSLNGITRLRPAGYAEASLFHYNHYNLNGITIRVLPLL